MSGRVLVTGAGGFVGSHLAATLDARGEEVVALDVHLGRLAHLEGEKLVLVRGDVGDAGVRARALGGVGTVYHLAAAHLGASVPESEFRRVNVEATRRLVEEASAAGARRFVHVSSVGVYGTIDRPPADETTPCRPEIAYERTKLEGEEAVLEAARGGGAEVVVLRPVWVYGPGCPRTEKLLRTIAKGRFVVAGRGEKLRHSIYVRDMVEAMIAAARSAEAVGEVMIVGGPEATTVRELVDEIARAVGARPPVSVPHALLASVAAAFELAFLPLGKEPPLSRRTLKFFTGNTAFDVSKARRLLGWGPRYDLARGLAETRRRLAAATPWRLEPEAGE